jgi:hypothetical protein
VVNLGGKSYRFSTPKSSAQDGDALAGERLAIPLGASLSTRRRRSISTFPCN